MTLDSSNPPFSQLLGHPCWYHGTSTKFQTWQIPPPKKDSVLVAHSAIFFTTNKNFALGAGPVVSKSSISPRANILDCTIKSSALEQLRLKVSQHRTNELFENYKIDNWYKGWVTGDVLRPLANESGVYFLKSLVPEQAKSLGGDMDVAWAVVQHNATRGLIEHICTQAINLGLDGLFGNEVDRHSGQSEKLAQPWLAIFNASAVSPPVWE